MALPDFDTLWDNLLTSSAPGMHSGQKYCAIQGIKGSRYRVGQGIAVIGRAPNGWPIEFCRQEAEHPARRAELVRRILDINVCVEDTTMIDGTHQCAPMHWVKHRRRVKSRVFTNSTTSRFWATISSTFKSLAEQRNREWEENIAWTNLYPVSFQCGNPTLGLARTQFKAGANLLSATLRYWSPKVAIFITEVNSMTSRTTDWSAPFHDVLAVRDIRRGEVGPIIASANILENTRAIFVVRPDSRRGPRHNFAGELAAALRHEGVTCVYET
jgi:hypothetical protein